MSLVPRIAYRIRTRYGYAADTCPRSICFFSFLREYWICGLIRIFVADTAQPNKSALSCPRRPSLPIPARLAPQPRASCSIPVRRPPATSDEPPSPLARRPRRVSAPATCPHPSRRILCTHPQSPRALPWGAPTSPLQMRLAPAMRGEMQGRGRFSTQQQS